MKIETDPLFDAALEFLNNGGELPPGALKDAKTRFVFQAALFRHIHTTAQGAMTLSKTNEKDIIKLGERIDNRTGVFAGVAAIATALLVALKALGWI